MLYFLSLACLIAVILRMQTSDPDKPSPERPLSRNRKSLHGCSPLNIFPRFPLVGSIAMKQLVSKVHLCAHAHAFSAWADLVRVAFMLSLFVRDTLALASCAGVVLYISSLHGSGAWAGIDVMIFLLSLRVDTSRCSVHLHTTRGCLCAQAQRLNLQ